MQAKIITYGGALVSYNVYDINKNIVDIVLGYDDLENYENQNKYMGAIIGRVCNRIEKGRFELNNKIYQLCCNDGNNHIHGGKYGFDKKVWDAEIQGDSLLLKYRSVDGEEGYPANVDVSVKYTLDEHGAIEIEYDAVSDEDTVINLTNHSYFNLSGHSSGTVENQYIQIMADKYTVADKESLPNGDITFVEGTPLDLRQPTLIGKHIDDNFEQLKWADGYDQNWVINDYDRSIKKAALAYDENTGIYLEVSTTLPGIQFYSGNYLNGAPKGKNGADYYKRCGFCLESQYFPNALSHKNFLQPILRKGQHYHSTTVFKTGLIK